MWHGRCSIIKYTWVYSESKLVYTYSTISMPLCWGIFVCKKRYFPGAVWIQTEDFSLATKCAEWSDMNFWISQNTGPFPFLIKVSMTRLRGYLWRDACNYVSKIFLLQREERLICSTRKNRTFSCNINDKNLWESGEILLRKSAMSRLTSDQTLPWTLEIWSKFAELARWQFRRFLQL